MKLEIEISSRHSWGLPRIGSALNPGPAEFEWRHIYLVCGFLSIGFSWLVVMPRPYNPVERRKFDWDWEPLAWIKPKRP